MVVEAHHAIGQQAHALQKVVGDHGPEHIELKIARGAAHIDGHVIAEDLTAQHGDRLALGRIDLARHDGRAWLVLRNRQLPDATARAAGQPAHVVGNFHQAGGQRFEGAVGMHQRVAGCQGLELVRRRHKGQTGQARQLGRRLFGIPLGRIQTGAHCGAAQGQLAQVRHGGEKMLLSMFKLRDVAGELLAQGQRRRVLQMGTADFDDAGKVLRFFR